MAKAAKKEYQKCRKTHTKKFCDTKFAKKKKRKTATVLDFDYEVADDIELPNGFEIEIKE